MFFSDLSEDALDQVLRRLPDFNTLAAAIRASKQLYNIFNAHPNSLKKEIAGNSCGHPDVLPAALRVVRTALKGQDDSHAEDDEDDIPATVVLPQPTAEEDMLEVAMTRAEAELIDRYGNVIRSLEDLYSWRRKDRTLPTSQLTAPESVRFKRGMYRFWLYCECYAPPEWDNGDVDHQEARSRAAVQFLKSFNMDECFEVAHAAAFCADMYGWNSTAFSTRVLVGTPAATFCREHSCLGPELILEDYQRLSCSQPEGAEHSGFFWNSFDEVVAQFNLKQDVREDKLAHAVMRRDDSSNDSCHRCHAIRGMDLWGATNWPLLRGFVSPAELGAFLPGRLPHNRSETVPLLHRYGADMWQSGRPRSDADETLTRMMTEIIDLHVDTGTDAWTQEGWYCIDCVRELFKQRLWRWWYAKKREVGTPEQQNCWYGWNCRTMTHRRTHADKLNHLCVPTRGDP